MGHNGNCMAHVAGRGPAAAWCGAPRHRAPCYQAFKQNTSCPLSWGLAALDAMMVCANVLIFILCTCSGAWRADLRAWGGVGVRTASASVFACRHGWYSFSHGAGYSPSRHNCCRILFPEAAAISVCMVPTVCLCAGARLGVAFLPFMYQCMYNSQGDKLVFPCCAPAVCTQTVTTAHRVLAVLFTCDTSCISAAVT
jgi:hypothetical protein